MQPHHPQLTGYSRSTGLRLLSQINFWTRRKWNWNASNPLIKRKGNQLEKIRIAMWLGFNSWPGPTKVCNEYATNNEQKPKRSKKKLSCQVLPRAVETIFSWVTINCSGNVSTSGALPVSISKLSCSHSRQPCPWQRFWADPGLGNVHNYIVTLANVGKQPAWLCQWLMLLANNNRTTWQSWNYIQESPPSNSPSEPLWTANAWPSWRPHNKCVLFLVFVSTSLYWEYKNSVVVKHPLSPWTLKIKFELHSPY